MIYFGKLHIQQLHNNHVGDAMETRDTCHLTSQVPKPSKTGGVLA